VLRARVPCRAGSKFYERLKELRDYHKRFPVYDVALGGDGDAEAAAAAAAAEAPQIPFSGEEGFGR
jgi:hypothetical protein